MLDANSALMLLLTFFGLLVLIRINRMISKVQQRQFEEQVIREIVKRDIQRKRIDELYGRGKHDK